MEITDEPIERMARSMNDSPLPPAEAARRFAENPDSVWFSLQEIMRVFGLSWDELRAELIAGRLQAEGVSDGNGGYSEVGVSGLHLMKWMSLTNAIAVQE